MISINVCWGGELHAMEQKAQVVVHICHYINIKTAYLPTHKWELRNAPRVQNILFSCLHSPCRCESYAFTGLPWHPSLHLQLHRHFTQCLSPQTQQFHNENLLFDFLQSEPAFSASLAWKERQDLVPTLRLKRFWELASTSFSLLSPIDFFPFKSPLKSNPLPFISIPTPPPHPNLI